MSTVKAHPREDLTHDAEVALAMAMTHVDYEYIELMVALTHYEFFTPAVGRQARVRVVEALRVVLAETCTRYGLTSGERMALIGNLLENTARRIIRIERHEDASKPSELE